MMQPIPCEKDIIGLDADVKVSGPLLVSSEHNCTEVSCYECAKAQKRRARSFQRAMSGLTVAGAGWRMWTLTLSDQDVERGVDIRRCWRALLMRMRRRSLLFGYFRVIERTKRGHEHLHVLVAGPPIPHHWVSESWHEITGTSMVVWVSLIRTHKGAAGYVAKYMGKDPEARYAWSWDWVWKGFVKDWKQHIRLWMRHGHDFPMVLVAWRGILLTYALNRKRGRLQGIGVSRADTRRSIAAGPENGRPKRLSGTGLNDSNSIQLRFESGGWPEHRSDR